jgi:hypothetical protein
VTLIARFLRARPGRHDRSECSGLRSFRAVNFWHTIGTLAASKGHQVPRSNSSKCLGWQTLDSV